MRTWLIGFLACLFLLQGCALEERPEQKNGTEGPSMSQSLLQAAERKDVESVTKLVKEGANVNSQDTKGRTPAMIATYNNDAATLKVLLDAGADVNIQDHRLNTPFLYAGAEGYLDILRLTIDAGADPAITNRYGGTALIPASEHGYVEVVHELLTRTQIDVNHVNNLGWTALLEAIILNDGGPAQQQTVRLLIQHGADVNLPDHDRVTPLQHARNKGFKDIERILADAGAIS
ncbi:ankyrin repeat domain-containing protein [Cohnella thailandensis]|uniref:Ankyrin repeat domain-containing protein n=1 Tax=Cohnella thailandensis TaxID=557557 RepID=A0A841SX77_9BACL|nr:ankyrin repeat domain-containing protein [Cohnella thailandensis]MBB6636853.1 ankyrin repeat domain-containing protein [Cohnella thailandensis]